MADIIANSASFTDVKAALAAAVTGDRVLIPAGTCTITKTIASTDPFAVGEDTSLGNKAIIIEGGYGGGETIFLHSIDYAAVNYGANGARPQAIYWLTIDHATAKSGFKNITFQGGSFVDSNNKGMLWIGGNTKKWLMYNCKIKPTFTSAVIFNGHVEGVNCYNTWDCSKAYGCYTYHDSWNAVGAFGDNSWATAHTMGTSHALFFENETFTNNQSAVTVQYSLDGWQGARRVVRYSSFTNCNVNDHGTESSGRQRGTRQSEIYNNTFVTNLRVSDWPANMSLRGGTGMIYNNTITKIGSGTLTRAADGVNYRNDPFEGFYIFGWAGKVTPVSITRTGTTATITFSARYGFANLHGFTDQDFLPAANTDMYVKVSGATDSLYNGIFQITGGTNTTVTYTMAGTPAANATGTLIVSSPWDGNTDAFGYRCIDQIGAGPSALISGDVPVPPGGGMAQGIEPAHIWNNTLNGVVSNFAINGTNGPSVVVSGRDYFNRAPQFGDIMSAYTAYTYPHPLNPGAPPGGGGGGGGGGGSTTDIYGMVVL